MFNKLIQQFKSPETPETPETPTEPKEPKFNADTFLPHVRVMGQYRYYATDHTWNKGPAAQAQAMCFATKAEYLEWVGAWKALYATMTLDAKENPWLARRWTRNERHAMLVLRKEGKVLSWSMKQARLAREAEQQ